MRRPVVIISALASAAALALTGCGSSVDSAEVEDQISSALEDQIGAAPDDVSCPDDLDAEVGSKTRCELTADGTTYGVSVEVTSVEGDVAQFDIQVDEEPSS